MKHLLFSLACLSSLSILAQNEKEEPIEGLSYRYELYTLPPAVLKTSDGNFLTVTNPLSDFYRTDYILTKFTSKGELIKSSQVTSVGEMTSDENSGFFNSTAGQYNYLVAEGPSTYAVAQVEWAENYPEIPGIVIDFFTKEGVYQKDKRITINGEAEGKAVSFFHDGQSYVLNAGQPVNTDTYFIYEDGVVEEDPELMVFNLSGINATIPSNNGRYLHLAQAGSEMIIARTEADTKVWGRKFADIAEGREPSTMDKVGYLYQNPKDLSITMAGRLVDGSDFSLFLKNMDELVQKKNWEKTITIKEALNASFTINSTPEGFIVVGSYVPADIEMQGTHYIKIYELDKKGNIKWEKEHELVDFAKVK